MINIRQKVYSMEHILPLCLMLNQWFTSGLFSIRKELQHREFDMAFFPRALLTISYHDKHKAKSVYSGTLECDHLGNLTTLLIGPLFGRPIWDFLYNLIIYHLDLPSGTACTQATLTKWPPYQSDHFFPVPKAVQLSRFHCSLEHILPVCLISDLPIWVLRIVDQATDYEFTISQPDKHCLNMERNVFPLHKSFSLALLHITQW